MYRDLRHLYYWSEMKRNVADFVQRCLTCQQVKAKHQKPIGATPTFGSSRVKVGARHDGLCDPPATDTAEA